MAKVFEQELQHEQVILDEPANLVIDSKEDAHTGRLVLTNKRLLYGPKIDGPPKIEIDLDTINKLERKTIVVDGNVISITYLQYQEVSFSVPDYQEWEDAIEEARRTPHV